MNEYYSLLINTNVLVSFSEGVFQIRDKNEESSAPLNWHAA